MGCAIQGIGIAGGFGCGLDALETALQKREPVAQTVMAYGRDIPAALVSLEPLEKFFPRRSLRRVDHFSQLALLGASLALEDAGTMVPSDRSRIGLIIASGYGPMGTTFAFLDSYLKGGDKFTSPTHFSYSVHNAAAANISILHQIHGPNLSVSQFEMSFAVALRTAQEWLAQGVVDAVLVGSVDEFCPELGYCWQRYFDLGDPCSKLPTYTYPGEGTAFYLLTNGESAQHGFVKEVRFGKAPLTEELSCVPLIVGRDGHAWCERMCYDIKADLIASYTHCYGSFPTAQAFDMTAALVSLSRRYFYPSALLGELAGNGGDTIEGVDKIHCLKFDAQKQGALITVNR
ncbi:beta-ketoacyl synthase N-terminal-like domain-containing protein [Chrysiogenes arsenatis]|uniref:beta-ketoacyl synthase N-terminal-like domain-containing protein n=1 Tax=Chrysiogenes arsenatis TaxID=309797 RepID=UPI00041B3C1C|nr:beta-ketoacyl synthase N-terminal-like domain-containing protein [Chrysiogenes arsenatis]